MINAKALQHERNCGVKQTQNSNDKAFYYEHVGYQPGSFVIRIHSHCKLQLN